MSWHSDALRERLVARIKQERELRYTDDTAMAIGLAESILEKGDIDQVHPGDVFKRNFHRELWRSYAAGHPTLFSMVEGSGLTSKEAAQSLFGGTGSLGNGAAMRIAPLVLCFHATANIGFCFLSAFCLDPRASFSYTPDPGLWQQSAAVPARPSGMSPASPQQKMDSPFQPAQGT